MKVLLINPPTKKAGVPSIPPLGLAYLAAVLRENNAAVDIIDYDLERSKFDNFNDAVETYSPDIIGISALTLQIDNAYSLAHKVKKISKDIRVVLGGAHPSALPEQTLKEASGAVDIVAVGEGEMTILDIAKGLSYENIKGIVYVNNGQILKTPPRQAIENLNTLPLPARDLLKIKKYRGWGPLRKTPTTHLISSRGCPFECIFCSEKSVFGKSYRVRSPENIVSEIKHLVDTYGMEEISFYDDLFTLDKKHVMEICEKLEQEKITIEWKALSRVNTVDFQMLETMRRAGCWLISYGFESGSQEILNAIRKNQTIEQCVAAALMTHQAGIKFYGFFMIGNVGETEETVIQTIRLARKLRPDYYQFTIVRPDPGSYLYNKYKDAIEKAHVSWEEYYAFSSDNSIPVVGTLLSVNRLLELRDIAYICTNFRSFVKGFIKAALTLKWDLLLKAVNILLNKEKAA